MKYSDRMKNTGRSKIELLPCLCTSQVFPYMDGLIWFISDGWYCWIQNTVCCETPLLIFLLVAVYITDTVSVWCSEHRSLSYERLSLENQTENHVSSRLLKMYETWSGVSQVTGPLRAVILCCCTCFKSKKKRFWQLVNKRPIFSDNHYY